MPKINNKTNKLTRTRKDLTADTSKVQHTQYISNKHCDIELQSTVESRKNAVDDNNSKIVSDETSLQGTPNNKINRRDFMVLTAASMAGVGIACSLWPFVDSLNPSADVLASSSIEVEIDKIQTGHTAVVSWRGNPVFIKHRTAEEIDKARSVSLSELIDPEDDASRVKAGYDQWLVVLGVCTHLGCIPIDHKGDYGGWFCPCHGSHYDTSGRIRKGPAPENLKVPQYQFINDQKIKIG